jgi:hypothetical protein
VRLYRGRTRFIATRRITSPRFRKVERYGPRSVGHYLSIRSPEELDDELRAWLKEAAAVGRQEHLGTVTPGDGGGPGGRGHAGTPLGPRRARR